MGADVRSAKWRDPGRVSTDPVTPQEYARFAPGSKNWPFCLKYHLMTGVRWFYTEDRVARTYAVCCTTAEKPVSSGLSLSDAVELVKIHRIMDGLDEFGSPAQGGAR